MTKNLRLHTQTTKKCSCERHNSRLKKSSAFERETESRSFVWVIRGVRAEEVMVKVGTFPRELIRVSNRDSLMVQHISIPLNSGLTPSDSDRSRCQKKDVDARRGETIFCFEENMKLWRELYADLVRVRANLNKAIALDKITSTTLRKNVRVFVKTIL